MHDFIKFMLGGYWNGMDSNAVGGRGTLVFCWLMLLWGVVSLLILLAN